MDNLIIILGLGIPLSILWFIWFGPFNKSKAERDAEWKQKMEIGRKNAELEREKERD